MAFTKQFHQLLHFASGKILCISLLPCGYKRKAALNCFDFCPLNDYSIYLRSGKIDSKDFFQELQGKCHTYERHLASP